jgi:hypothetical protein
MAEEREVGGRIWRIAAQISIQEGMPKESGIVYG